MKASTSKEESNQQNIGTKSGSAVLSSAGKKVAKDPNVASKKRKKQRKHPSPDTSSRSQPLMPDTDKLLAPAVVSSVRTPETMAKILLILYTHAKGSSHTYNLGISAFRQLSGMAVITDEYVSTVDKYLRPNHFCLIRLKDNFSVTTLAELLASQVMNPKVVCRYLPRNIKETVLESEYARLRKSWRWSLSLK